MKEVITQYIKKELLNGREDIELRPEDDLLANEFVDSLGMMQLITFIEQKFEMKVPFEDITIENFETIDAIGEYLAERKQN